MVRLLIAVTSVCIWAASAVAEDWTQFRGPDGDGHSSATNLPVEWSSSKNVAWKKNLPGTGWSSPIVLGERIFLTAAVPRSGDEGTSEQNLFVLCVDANSGEVVWQTLLFEQTGDVAQKIHKKNSHASSTPVTDGTYLWVHFGAQGTACLTLDGQVVWKMRDLKYNMTHGNGESPVVVDDILFINCDGNPTPYVAALDKLTGQIKWRKERPEVEIPKKFAFCSPTVIEVNGQTQIVSPGAGIVTAYAPADGREIWSVKYDGYSVIPKPIFANGLVFVCTSYDTSKLYAIDPTGSGDVTETHVVWKNNRNIAHTPSLLVIGDELYCISDRGVGTCFDVRTGEVHWQERIGGRNYSASPMYADGKIYCLSEEGVATILKPGKKFEKIAENDLGERTLASYAVIGDDLLIRTEENLYRIR